MQIRYDAILKALGNFDCKESHASKVQFDILMDCSTVMLILDSFLSCAGFASTQRQPLGQQGASAFNVS